MRAANTGSIPSYPVICLRAQPSRTVKSLFSKTHVCALYPALRHPGTQWLIASYPCHSLDTKHSVQPHSMRASSPLSLSLSPFLTPSLALSLSRLSLFWRRLLHISQAGRLRAWDFPTPHSKPLILCFGGNIKRRGIERQLLL